MLNQLSRQCYNASKIKGFHDSESATKDLPEPLRNQIQIAFSVQAIALIITELSEAIEALRNGKFAQDISDINAAKKEFVLDFERLVKDTYQDEIADAAIRIFDLCGKNNIDLDSHVHLKMRYNATRPPKHGKSF